MVLPRPRTPTKCMRRRGDGPDVCHVWKRGDTQLPSGRPFAQLVHRPISAEGSLYERCCEHSTEWKLEGHGCAACRHIMPASLWPRHDIARHRFGRDLVCPAHREKGNTTGRYESYKCNVCLEHLEPLRFDSRRLQVAVQESRSDVTYETCRTSSDQYSRCLQNLGSESWKKKNDMPNNIGKGTKLVCDACREKGFPACDVGQYTCHTCKKVFGAGKMPKKALKQLKRPRSPI